MKTRDGTVTPELRFEITQENYERAIKENSGSCIVADAIKEKYPQFSNVKVDVATVRFTDKERGLQYIYLTTPSVRDTLLFFDQGWNEEMPKTLRLRTTLRIIPITRSASDLKIKAERRAARVEELEAKEQSGEQLTSDDKRALKRLRNRQEPPARPTSYGPMENEIVKGDEVIIRGAPERTTGKYKKGHPNMLAGKDRHYGAKTAKPGIVFQEAVKVEAHAKAQEIAQEILAKERAKKNQ